MEQSKDNLKFILADYVIPLFSLIKFEFFIQFVFSNKSQSSTSP